MDQYIYWMLTFGYLALLVAGLFHTQSRLLSYSNVLILVTLGLIYDNLIVSLGSSIGEGAFLEALNIVRFWLHAFLTPALVLFGYEVIRTSLHSLRKNRYFLLFTLVYTATLVLLEIFTVTLSLEITPKSEYGILHYVPKGEASIPLMIIGIVIWMLVSGIIIWRKKKWVWMFIGTSILIIGSSIPFHFHSSALLNICEYLFIASLWATKVKA